MGTYTRIGWDRFWRSHGHGSKEERIDKEATGERKGINAANLRRGATQTRRGNTLKGSQREHAWIQSAARTSRQAKLIVFVEYPI